MKPCSVLHMQEAASPSPAGSKAMLVTRRRSKSRAAFRLCRSLILRALIVAMLVAVSQEGHAQSPLGARPEYVTRDLTEIPNAQALRATIWLPGLNDGYVPQGIVLVGERLFVSAYKSIDRKQDRGPCRLFALDVRTGATLAHLDLPKACGHAGGLAKGEGQTLILTDARVIFEIELAGAAEKSLGRVKRAVRLGGGVKGSFAASDSGGFWIGEYARSDAGKMFRFPWSALQKQTLTEADAVEVLSSPIYAQGAAIDSHGALWVMRSGSKFGELVKLDRRTGVAVARFAMPAGAEGISFAPDGTLWTLSEAGSQRWSEWAAFYPLAFRFDPKFLR